MAASKPEGIYMCVDYRITRGHRAKDDGTKYVTVHYPPLDAGLKAMFGFAGAAEYRDGTPTMTRLRETLRGQVEDVKASLAHLEGRQLRNL